MRDGDLIEGFFLNCRTKNLSPATLRCYADRLAILVSLAKNADLDLTTIAGIDILRYVDAALRKNSAETVNGRLRAWRVFYNYLWSSGYIEHNPMEKIRLVRVKKQQKRILSSDEVSAMINSQSFTSFLGVRNRTMILTFYDAKLRVGELCRLRVGDVNFSDLFLRVGEAKGGRGRMVAFSNETARDLHRYLRAFRSDLPGDQLFCLSGGGALTEDHCRRTIERIGGSVGIPCFPHKLRHSGATQFVINGGSLYQLMLDMGHSSITTTEIYVHAKDIQAAPEMRKFSPANQLKIKRRAS